MHEPLTQLLARTYSAAEREVIYRLIRGGSVGVDRTLRSSNAIYRICGAIQNLWLAACAEGLRVEWIKRSDERAVAGRAAAHR